MSNTFKFIDLFSGIGGFHIALKKNGGKCVGFSEINKDAISTYCKNLGEKESSNLGDITRIKEIPSHDLLTAGVPCQSWSIAGRNLGFDDDRGKLWNDTIYLLQHSKPKAFIFENVKGLVDPRNKEALSYILNRIKDAGYHANFHVINSHDYGVPQNRIRIYIIGFREKIFLDKFTIPKKVSDKINLSEIISENIPPIENIEIPQCDLFDKIIPTKSLSLSSKNGFNNYFLFNDIRNGDTTIHSWDIIKTTKRQKIICYTLLKNRRKSAYGALDGNPLSIKHFQELDPSITQKEINTLIKLDIFKAEEYIFEIKNPDKINKTELTTDEGICLIEAINEHIVVDELKSNAKIKIKKISVKKSIEGLKNKGLLKCKEIRYDFKNTKISTGLFGVNRIFLPSSDIFPTLVASDTNDYISTIDIKPKDNISYRMEFLDKIYKEGLYRKITKSEACLIQGFPENFDLPNTRPRWMKLVGNSVSVPVIEKLCNAIIQTGVFRNAAINQPENLI